ASEHIQNDVYGQALIALLPLFSDHRFRHQNVHAAKSWTYLILQKMAQTIDEKDAGIWEFRNFQNRHCYSNLFQWAGATAALKIAKQYGFEDMEQQANAIREQATKHIESCYDEERKVYTNATESQSLDASTLQLIMMNYLDPSSERAKKHLEQLERGLNCELGCVYGYLRRDDSEMPLPTFLVCAGLCVESLDCVGRIDAAAVVFQHVLSFARRLVLFSAEVHADEGSQWAAFPLAY